MMATVRFGSVRFLLWRFRFGFGSIGFGLLSVRIRFGIPYEDSRPIFCPLIGQALRPILLKRDSGK